MHEPLRKQAGQAEDMNSQQLMAAYPYLILQAETQTSQTIT